MLLNSPVPAQQSASSAIVKELEATADAWNSADLARHVQPYADSATMMGNRGPVPGRDAIASMLARGFWRDGKPLQQLQYESIVVRELGPAHALVTGRFILTGGDQPERSGWFSLVWERVGGRWLIIHDHSG
jgi:uncharacterized protein (TIGR02246 family)